MSMVIPDTIEPYVGYKALRIGTDGQLRSPQQTQFVWPVGKRATASCAKHGNIYEWKLVPKGLTQLTPQRPTIFPQLEQRIVTTTTTSTQIVNYQPYPGPPPEGYEYIWVEGQHQPGGDGCTCGIYAVESIEQCISYMRADCVICEIALWGQVTTAYKGARGQYGYPQKMLIPQHLMDVGPLVADLYGIPFEEQTFIRRSWPEFQVTHWPAQHEAAVKKAQRLKAKQERRDAGSAALVFCGITGLLWPAAMATYKAAGLWSILPAIAALLVSLLTLVAFLDWKKPLPEA